MLSLNRKLVRDLWHIRGQAIAISLVVGGGVALFVLALSCLQSLEYSQQTYYDRYRFASVFAHLKRAPQALSERIREIPGVAQVETRVVVNVNLDVPGLEDPAVGKFISLPDTAQPKLNLPHLRQGRMLRPRRDDEALVSEAFAKANRLHVGDSFKAVLNGRKKQLRVVGIALSPEFIYEIQPGDLLPDNRHFGIFWMGEEALSIAFDLEAAFNDVSLSLKRGASEQEVIDRLDDLIEPYGGLGSYGRDDQISHKFISNEINELRGMGMVAPSIFLGVAAFLLNVVMSRLLGTQREQIAALKAFGYGNTAVAWHYIKLVLAITSVGMVVGTIAGLHLGRGMTVMYAEFFHFPVFKYEWGGRVIPLAWIVSSLAAVAGTAAAVLRAVRLPPAEAMRPEPPANYRVTLLEWIGAGRLLSPVGRMVLRHFERRPIKALLSCVAVAMAVAVLVLGNFMRDSIAYVIESEFFWAQRYDMSIGTVEPVAARAIQEIEHLPGVRRAEPTRSVSTRMRGAHLHRRVSIVGLSDARELYELVDVDRQTVKLPPDGLVVSATLAELLGVAVGDPVTVEVLERHRPVRQIPIVGTIRDFSGTTAYMNLTALQRLMREGPTINGAYLDIDRNRRSELYSALKAIPNVATVTIKEAAVQSFRDTIAENLLRMQLINVVFAVIIALGVVYNSARISLAERSRELATLRVIGFTRAEISTILLGELAVITTFAIPLGLIIGRSFCHLVSASIDQELFRIPVIISSSTYAFAAIVVIVATIGSGLIVRRKLDHLDLIAVLKSSE